MFDLGTASSWLQFIILLVSVITVGIKVGKFQGTQEQINKNQENKNDDIEKRLDGHDQDVNAIKENIGEIRVDIGKIKTKLNVDS